MSTCKILVCAQTQTRQSQGFYFALSKPAPGTGPFTVCVLVLKRVITKSYSYKRTRKGNAPTEVLLHIEIN